jgi:hypothetical protein
MNHSLLTANRNTHLKMVVVALLAALVVVVAGVNARVSGTGASSPRTTTLVVKAGKPAVYSIRDTATVH